MRKPLFLKLAIARSKIWKIGGRWNTHETKTNEKKRHAKRRAVHCEMVHQTKHQRTMKTDGRKQKTMTNPLKECYLLKR